MTADAAQADDGSLGERLLADLRTVFGTDDRLASATILARLRELEESPWADLDGRGLDARGLARLLRRLRGQAQGDADRVRHPTRV